MKKPITRPTEGGIGTQIPKPLQSIFNRKKRCRICDSAEAYDQIKLSLVNQSFETW